MHIYVYIYIYIYIQNQQKTQGVTNKSRIIKHAQGQLQFHYTQTMNITQQSVQLQRFTSMNK